MHSIGQLSFVIRTHGGARAGAGRKRKSARSNVPHRPRPRLDARHPVHLTLRAGALPASLRDRRAFPALRSALAFSTDALRILHFSVQHDHLHLLVETDEPMRFARAVQGLAIRIARAVNRALGRHGAVFADRYHTRALRTPREVRHALVYVLQNWRKHGHRERGFDPCSSAMRFDGWKGVAAIANAFDSARTLLARCGWRGLGLLDPRERPAGSPLRLGP
jgi:REP element-mobilizing transposase RayT